LPGVPEMCDGLSMPSGFGQNACVQIKNATIGAKRKYVLLFMKKKFL
jgi:hypothetical protein